MTANDAAPRRRSALRRAIWIVSGGLVIGGAVCCWKVIPPVLTVERLYRKTHADWHRHMPVKEEHVQDLGGVEGATRKLVAYLELPKAVISKRRFAVQSLIDLGRAKEAVPALIQFLDDGDHSVRVEGACGLAQAKDARAVQPLVVALKSDDYSLRAFAAQALGEIGDSRAVEPLKAALNDNRTTLVRAAIEQALAKLPAPKP